MLTRLQPTLLFVSTLFLLTTGCDPASPSEPDQDSSPSATGKADGAKEQVLLCDANEQCLDGETCDFTECNTPSCPPDLDCPTVCFGACTALEDVPLPNLCDDAAQCEAGQTCDFTECHTPWCDDGLDCPAVCLGACADVPEMPPEPGLLCVQDEDCSIGSCDTTECHTPQCPPGLDCPAVCLGICAEEPTKPEPMPEPLCEDDLDCGPMMQCDTSVCHAPDCDPGLSCPAVCLGQCEPL